MLLFAWFACTTPTDTSAKDSSAEVLDPATVPLGGRCPLATDYGGIELLSQAGTSSLDGSVADGVVPQSVLETITSDGGCEIRRRNNPYCDPGCEAGYTCDFDGTCVEYPANQDLGTLTVSGLVQASSMDATFPGNTYYDTSLPDPAYTPGGVLTLSMPGGTYGPAELHGVGVEPLDITGLAWTFTSGTDATLTWPAPTGSVVRSSIQVDVSIDLHGMSPSSLVCTFDDTGTATVPADIVDGLVSAGVTGFPTGTLTRLTADSVAAGAGCMDFVVASAGTIPVSVTGHTPCVSDEDCPDGETCNLDLQTCE